MQFNKNKISKIGEARAGLFLLGAGIILGIVLSRVLKGSYWNQLSLLDSNYFDKIKTAAIQYSTLFQYVIWKNFSTFILFWILCSTPVGIPYIVLFIIFTGFKCGFFLSVIIMGYGFKGILLILGYTFPHYLIYGLVFLLSLKSGFRLCRSLYHEGRLSSKGKVERIAKHIVIIAILGVTLFLGSLLETYAGTFLLKKILLLF